MKSMASLTPGVLLKLLQSMIYHSDAPSSAKLHIHHRPSILQLTGITPSTSDLLPPSCSNGFYIQVSDSLNSTYVWCTDRDADSLQLGQLVHVDCLIPSHPVPHALNLRPIPFLGRSPPPIYGSPSPLSFLFSPSDPSSFVIQPATPDSSPLFLSAGAPSAKENPPSKVPDGASKRRFSSPGMANRRDPSPGGTGKFVGSRSSSPVPSKCIVPSLAAAKDEGRKTAREAAIIVPSRYRQPSPVVGRKGSVVSPMGRRGSMSPIGGRRLSSGVVLGGGGEKKRAGVVVAGIARISDGIVGMERKSWEENLGEMEKVKAKSSSKVVDQKAILRTQRLGDATREQPNTEDPQRSEKKKTVKKFESSQKEKPKNITTKIKVHDPKWTDGSIPFDTVSENLAKLGKEALQRRNIASIAAAEALEEAYACESVIRCLSMFSDLCSSSQAGNPLPTINRFLSIYDDILKWISISESIVFAGITTTVYNESVSTDKTRPASLWVDAALATDLEVLSLLTDLEGYSKCKVPPKTSIPVMVDAPRTSFSKRNSQAKVSTNAWTRGQHVGDTVNFAKSLRREMQNWFMKFVEDALDVGFRLFGEVEASSCKDNGRVAAVLSQLKRVNDWLDSVGKKKEEEAMLVEKIERLKRKIYGFVITHVGSAFDRSVSLSKVG